MNKRKLDKQPFAGCLSLLKENILLVAGIVITFSLCMYSILGVFGFSAYPDEFGYWSPAAAILGYDWSAITSLGSFYSYGYSILLVPILSFFDGAINTYRAAVSLNLILQCISIPLIYCILINVFPADNRNIAKISAVISVLYPAWVFYTQTTMAESLLSFLFVLSAYLMLLFFEKPSVLKGFFCALVLMYCYFVHMRCLGTIAAGVLTLIIWLFSQRKSNNKNKIGKKVWLIPVIIVVLFVASFTIKSFVIDNLYHSAGKDMLSWNDYSSVPHRILRTFTDGGVKYLFQDVCGKLLYLGLATYGTAYFGIYFYAKNFASVIKKIKRREYTHCDFLKLYLFLATFAQFMVALIYLNGPFVTFSG